MYLGENNLTEPIGVGESVSALAVVPAAWPGRALLLLIGGREGWDGVKFRAGVHGMAGLEKFFAVGQVVADVWTDDGAKTQKSPS